MATVTLQQLQRESAKRSFPAFKAGQTVRVHEKIKEGDKERVQIFEGLIIQTGGQGAGKTITVRKIIGGIGVEKIFSIHSAVIDKIDLVKEAKTRRSRIFFMRERSGKSARLKEKFLTEKDLQEMTASNEPTEEDIEEAVQAEKVKEEEEAKKAEETTEAPTEEVKVEPAKAEEKPAEEAPAEEEVKKEETEEKKVEDSEK